MGMSAFGMESKQPTITVSLGYWKNDTDKNVILIQDLGGGKLENIARLPAKSEINLKKEIKLSEIENDTGFFLAEIYIRDSQNPKEELLMQVGHIGITDFLKSVDVSLLKKTGTTRVVNRGDVFNTEPNWRTIDEQDYKKLSAHANTNIVIQGTIRGDNFGKSKIELLGVEH
jgi:hypothetical protein